MNVYIKLIIAGIDTGPFDLYSDVDNFAQAFETGVSKNALVNGYVAYSVPEETTQIKVQSTGTCTNFIIIDVAEKSITTTTTSTTALIPCQGAVCSTEMTVGYITGYAIGGEEQDAYGYMAGVAGAIDPDCKHIHILVWATTHGRLYLYTGTCYTSTIIQIDGHEFVMTYDQQLADEYIWKSQIIANPLVSVEQTSNIRICGVECTTSTTSTTTTQLYYRVSKCFTGENVALPKTETFSLGDVLMFTISPDPNTYCGTVTNENFEGPVTPNASIAGPFSPPDCYDSAHCYQGDAPETTTTTTTIIT